MLLDALLHDALLRFFAAARDNNRSSTYICCHYCLSFQMFISPPMFRYAAFFRRRFRAIFLRYATFIFRHAAI